jgi:hypothetical protein
MLNLALVSYVDSYIYSAVKSNTNLLANRAYVMKTDGWLSTHGYYKLCGLQAFHYQKVIEIMIDFL